MTASVCAIYCRISSDREGAGLGVQRQEQDCRKLAEERGWEVGHVYVDNDISAFSGRARPQYQQMLADVAAKKYVAIVAWHTDRLHRSTRELEDFIQVIGDVPVHTVRAGLLDLSTPAGRATAKTLGAWAQYESEAKSDRIKRKALQLAEEGKEGGGGTRPFGYTYDRKNIVEDEAEMIRWAMQQIYLGSSLGAICARWNDEGKPPVTGKEWTQPQVRRVAAKEPDSETGQEVIRRMTDGESATAIMHDLNARNVPIYDPPQWSRVSLRRMLRSGRIAGLRLRHGELVIVNGQPVKGQWPAIITPEDFLKLRTILDDPRRRTNGGMLKTRRLLTGLLVCSMCGSKMVSRPQQNEKDGTRMPSYVCDSVRARRHGCGNGKLRVKGAPLEDLVVASWLWHLRPEESDAERPVWPDDADPEHLYWIARGIEIQSQISELDEDYYVRKEIPRDRWLRMSDTLSKELANQREMVVKTAGVFASFADLPSTREELWQEWQSESLAWRRAALARVIERVVIRPAFRGRNTFDASRITIEWRV